MLRSRVFHSALLRATEAIDVFQLFLAAIFVNVRQHTKEIINHAFLSEIFLRVALTAIGQVRFEHVHSNEHLRTIHSLRLFHCCLMHDILIGWQILIVLFGLEG